MDCTCSNCRAHNPHREERLVVETEAKARPEKDEAGAMSPAEHGGLSRHNLMAHAELRRRGFSLSVRNHAWDGDVWMATYTTASHFPSVSMKDEDPEEKRKAEPNSFEFAGNGRSLVKAMKMAIEKGVEVLNIGELP